MDGAHNRWMEQMMDGRMDQLMDRQNGIRKKEGETSCPTYSIEAHCKRDELSRTDGQKDKPTSKYTDR